MTEPAIATTIDQLKASIFEMFQVLADQILESDLTGIQPDHWARSEVILFELQNFAEEF